MEKFGWALRECALQMQDSETILRVEWELLSRGKRIPSLERFPVPVPLLIRVGLAFHHRPSWHYNIHRSLEDIPVEKPKPSVVLRAEDVVSSSE